MKAHPFRSIIARLLSALTLAATPAALARPQLGAIEDVEPTNNTLAGATHIPRSASNIHRGICTLTPGDNDCFSISVGGIGQPAAGHAFVIITTPIDSLPTNHTTPDTVVEVLNPNNTLIASDDDSGTDYPVTFTRGSVVRFITSAAGDYRIRISGFDAVTSGRYLLTVAEVDIAEQEIFPHWVADLDSPVPPGTTDIIDARTAPAMLGYASMSGPADLDHLAIDLAVGDDLTVSVCTGSGIVNNTWNDINPTISIIAPDAATTLATDTNDGAGQSPGGSNTGVGGTIRLRAPATGRYYLRIQNTAGSSFAAVITSVLPAPPACPGDANNDGAVTFTDITTVLANFGNICP